MLPKKIYSSLKNGFHYPFIIDQPRSYVICFAEDFLYKFLYVLNYFSVELAPLYVLNYFSVELAPPIFLFPHFCQTLVML